MKSHRQNYFTRLFSAAQNVKFIAMSLALLGCSGEENSELGSYTFTEFENHVYQFAPENTRNCGVVRFGEDYTPVNTCVAESFVNEENFLAIYELEGFEPQNGLRGLAITMENNQVRKWYYISDPGAANITTCDEPLLTGILYGEPDEILSCDEPSNPSQGNQNEFVQISFNAFALRVRESTPENATNCGVVSVGESPAQTSDCVSEAFTQGEEFLAIFESETIDSDTGSAVTYSEKSGVIVWYYDSNPCGGPDCNSTVRRTLCIEASLSEAPTNIASDIFSCEKTIRMPQ